MPDLPAAAIALTDMAAIHALKTLDEAGAFGGELDALVTRAYRGRMGVSAFAAQMDDLLAEYIRSAYIEGLAEGGVEEGEMDAADEKAIRELVRAQRPYVDGFAQAVMDAKKEEDARAQIGSRIVMWSKSIRAAGVAGLNSAAADEVVIFAGKGGHEDCPTCHQLMGTRKRRSWFAERGLVPGIPGNEKDGERGFECGGWNCEHFLAPVGKAQRN